MNVVHTYLVLMTDRETSCGEGKKEGRKTFFVTPFNVFF